MRDFRTSTNNPVPRAANAIELTRAQILGATLLACIPLPLFSLATTVVPLPEVIERVAASFIPFASPTLPEQPDRVVRPRAEGVRTVQRPERSQQSTPVGTPSRATPVQRAPVRSAGPATQADPSTAETPSEGTADAETGSTSSPAPTMSTRRETPATDGPVSVGSVSPSSSKKNAGAGKSHKTGNERSAVATSKAHTKQGSHAEPSGSNGGGNGGGNGSANGGGNGSGEPGGHGKP